MSLLIKGMEMPKNCDKCKFSWWDVGHLYCEADGKPWGLEVTEYADGRHPNCPIIEVAEDVQPVKHGEWLEREQVADIQIDEWQSCRCSVCKKYHITPFLYYFNNYNYCPNCGAKMDGET